MTPPAPPSRRPPNPVDAFQLTQRNPRRAPPADTPEPEDSADVDTQPRQPTITQQQIEAYVAAGEAANWARDTKEWMRQELMSRLAESATIEPGPLTLQLQTRVIQRLTQQIARDVLEPELFDELMSHVPGKASRYLLVRGHKVHAAGEDA